MKNLQVQELTLAFGEREILKDISFTMNGNTRAALSGANGSGKSTMLKALTGIIPSDSRKLSVTKDSRISYLPQSDIVLPEKSIYETAEEGYDRFQSILDEITFYEEKTQQGGDQAISAAEKLSELHETLLDSGYWDRRARIETILLGLGFSQKDFKRQCREFSGGYQMRVALARVLVENPDFLLLDEPTNYLDIEAMTWLEDYLKAFNGGLMVVSHDQEFLDTLVTEVYELFNGRLTRYVGNYTKYTETREKEIEALEKAAKRQQEEMEKTEEFIERFRYKATKAKQVQSRIKMMEKTEIIEIPGHLKKLHFSFPPCPHSGNDVMVVENLSKSYGDTSIYSNFSFLVEKGERLAITGRNGAGKSTLLRILAGVDTEFSGTVKDGAGVKKGYFAQDTENTLNPDNDLVEELETVAVTKDQPRLRSMLGSFLFSDDDVFKKVKVLSGGEKSRLALLKILLHPSNLLLLDEPTNHLDINAKEMLLKEARWKTERKARSAPPIQEKKAGERSFEEQKARRNKAKSLEKEMDRISKEMEELEMKIKEMEEESLKVEVYSVSARIKEVLAKKESYEKELEEKKNLWLEKSQELEDYLA